MLALYDGTLAGLLSVVFDCFDKGLEVERLERERRFQPSLLSEPVRVATDEAHARRVWAGIEKWEPFDTELVLRCWLFDTTQSDTDILRLLVRTFREGIDAATDFRDEGIFRCQQVHKKMFREIHRTHAFVRFSEAEDGLYFALIEPDFDVLPLAVEHFERRYPDQEWMIWDGHRNYGFWWQVGGTKSQVVRPEDVGLTATAVLRGAAREDNFQKLWHTYFRSVNIEERANPKLHRAHVPTRYWKRLTEKLPGAAGAIGD